MFVTNEKQKQMESEMKGLILIKMTEIENFMTPGAGVLVLGNGRVSHIVKMHISFVIFLSVPGYIDKMNI